MNPGALFCFGLGYSAGFLARSLAAEGWRVAGTSREGGAAPDGTRLERFTRGAPLADAGAMLGRTTHLLISVPPDDGGDPVLVEHAREIAALPDLVWLGYLSTTGVYGDRSGGWVDESAPLLPTGERGRRRVAAEQGWLELRREHGVPVHVFRLAGIYGPGRSALDTVRSGRAQRIDKPGQVFSRIHVADIAQVLRASMARPAPGRVYNLCDDDAAPPEVVIAEACRLIGVAPPPLIPFAEARLSPMARSFYDDNKRVSNRRLKEELGIRLLYPSYRDGLKALLHDERASSSLRQ
ncbi:MAG TPA: SDR family oxidoreductase [Stellaceae bacterium]|nr:SDR family oxidoreductase [Stellaceae bacterium]